MLISMVMVISATDTGVDEAREAGRKVWMVVDAIQKHHIDSPDPEILWRTIVHSICTPDELKDPEPLIAQFVKTRMANECGDLLARRFEEGKPSHGPLSQLQEKLLKPLEKQLGPMSLQRAKDHTVNEQIRNNRYVGLGVTWHYNDASKYPVFTSILPGGSAERGGLVPGTIVTKVNGRSTDNVPQETLIDWLRGPIGTQVTLTVAGRQGQVDHDVTLTRDVVRTDSVLRYGGESIKFGISHPANPTIGWLKISAITASTLHELRVIDGVARQQGIRALVLEFSGGSREGDFHQAKLVADGLLESSPIWISRERNAPPRLEVADDECLFRGIPLVILVGQWTTGDQAAIAAALQDAGRATIVGESPDFRGEVFTGVAIDQETILQMKTTQIQRARSDRNWPLTTDIPPISRAIPAAEQKAISTYLLFLGTAKNPPVSALFPANVRHHPIHWENRIEETALNTALKLSTESSTP
ncbi:MAG: PDZ domain-containing protein [Planctomycetaceae bacterium]